MLLWRDQRDSEFCEYSSQFILLVQTTLQKCHGSLEARMTGGWNKTIGVALFMT